uniref:Neuromedin-K receptor-like n=1 Tax=Saccoglossus kowalevskii TaxID=10224 RepID=A0ABM0MFC1_SACKO|nr:PREDICTED: neuromedin-K receptor-like [Saccoglossus kowalevskii]
MSQTTLYGRARRPLISVIVSICTLTAIGIDRYFAVMHPLKVRVTKNRTKIVFSIIWLIAISLATVQTVFVRVEENYFDGETVYFCSEWLSEFQFAKAYEIFFLMATYTIPLCILCYTYSCVGVRLWGRTIPGNADKSRDQSQAKAKKKVREQTNRY